MTRAQQPPGAAAVLRAAPAFSFGTRAPQHDDALHGPGPGAYSIKLASSNFRSPAGVGFGTSVRSGTYANGNPGPQEYNPSLAQTHHSSSAASIRGRPPPPGWQAKTPGPGQYNSGEPAAVQQQHPAAPAFSLGLSRPPDREAERRPAPGDYSPQHQGKRHLPATMKFRHDGQGHGGGSGGGSSGGSSAPTPGPGEYYSDRAVHRGHSPPAHTMGASRRPDRKAELLPGPGQYSPYLHPRPAPCKFPKSLRDVRGSRFDLKPGPGAYFASAVRRRPGGFSAESLRRSAPAVTITCRHFESGASPGPAPGDYKPSLALVRTSSPQFTFRGVVPKDTKSKDPGPGQYTPLAEQQHPASPSVTLGSRLQPPEDADRRPPPGEYDPQRFKPKDQLPVTLKFRHESTPTYASVAPGPGEYPLAGSIKTGKGRGVTMGQRHRTKAGEALPGPADYDLQDSTLGVAAAGKQRH